MLYSLIRLENLTTHQMSINYNWYLIRPNPFWNIWIIASALSWGLKKEAGMSHAKMGQPNFPQLQDLAHTHTHTERQTQTEWPNPIWTVLLVLLGKGSSLLFIGRQVFSLFHFLSFPLMSVSDWPTTTIFHLNHCQVDGEGLRIKDANKSVEARPHWEILLVLKDTIHYGTNPWLLCVSVQQFLPRGGGGGGPPGRTVKKIGKLEMDVKKIFI